MTLLRREFLIASVLAAASGARAQADPWQALRTGGAFVLMRHATAPGTGDPPGFKLGDCSTQRNLSGEGRRQARRVGDLFRTKGIAGAQVFSSQWCRCVDTAVLLDLGDVRKQPLLNSFFGRSENRDSQTEALGTWITGLAPDRPVILVTHQVNITALVGVVPASGELVFVRRAANRRLAIVGRVQTGT